MGRFFLRIVLGLAAGSLYLLGYTGLAVLFVVGLVYVSIQQQLARIVGILTKLAEVPQEHDANCVLIYTFRMDRIFEHPAVDALFTKMKAAGKAPADTLDGWRGLLRESYARKYTPATTACEVRFNIKNNILFRNGEVDFGDHIYHALEIPFRWTDGKPEERAFMTPSCEAQLSIRVLVVNGLLHLQVGEFDKQYSPSILRASSLAVYETHATVTSFPLMYFSYEHGIPVRYLNLVAAATPSYKASHGERADQKRKWNTRYTDWKALNRDVAAYRVLCDGDNPNYGYKQIEQLSAAFKEKREKLLAADGYKTFDHDGEDSWRYPDTGHTYCNPYGQVFFRNMNANRDRHQTAHWFTDYYEEQP